MIYLNNKDIIFDTHSHLNLEAFSKDRDMVIKKCLANNVWMINAGVDYQTSLKAKEIAERYPVGVYAAVGLHPENISHEDFKPSHYKTLAKSSKVLAVGEIGLDYWKKPKEQQKFERLRNSQAEIFSKQLKLASQLNLPVIIHCRKAHYDLLEILERFRKFHLRGVVHSFVGEWAIAEKYLAKGFYLGFNGIIFRNIEGVNFEDVIRKTPLERILLETDSPYLTPPQAATKRNEPIFAKYVAQEIAKIKNTSLKKIKEATFKNAQELFKLGVEVLQ